MLVTSSGIWMLVKSVQSANARSQMLVTPFGMLMIVKLVQSQKA